jgi:hypothetical protein
VASSARDGHPKSEFVESLEVSLWEKERMRRRMRGWAGLAASWEAGPSDQIRWKRSRLKEVRRTPLHES